MLRGREHGFTLIEVVVAFVIFSLSIGVLFQIFGESLRTSEQVRIRDLEWLTAQSLISQLSMKRSPWPPKERGVSGSLRWSIEVRPYLLNMEKESSWNAYSVEVRVAPLHAKVPIVRVDCVKLSPRQT